MKKRIIRVLALTAWWALLVFGGYFVGYVRGAVAGARHAELLNPTYCDEGDET